jgi:VCBS repeat-containing protein
MSSRFSFHDFMDWYAAQDGARFSFGLIRKYLSQLEVNADPVANNVSYSGVVEDGGSLTFAFSATDSDGDDLTYSLARQPNEGIVKENSDGTFSFDPSDDFQDLAAGETREVSFGYRVQDGNGGSDLARATVTVTGTNDSPIAKDVRYGGVEEDGAAQVFAYGATDVDGDDLGYTVLSQPAEGAVVDNGDGTFSFNPGSDFQDLGEGETRAVSFSFEVSDGNGGHDTATATIIVTGTNDAPTAGILTAIDEEDKNTVTVDLLASAADLDGDTLTVIHVEEAPNGTVTDNGDGTVTYVPDPDFNGDDTFAYTISDGNGGESQGSVTVQVAAVNDAPTAADDAAETDVGTVISIDLLSNDNDVDGDVLTISSIGSAENGSVTNNGDGTVSYAPNAGFAGTDSFTYTVSDGNGGQATATATVAVLAANLDPVANDISYGGVEEDGIAQVFAYDASAVCMFTTLTSTPSIGTVSGGGA